MKKLFSYIFLLIGGVILIILCYKNGTTNPPKVNITEVCSHNNTIIYNNEGYYYDFVELHNTENRAVDLSGWCLTDSLTDKESRKLILDDVILESGDYYVVFVSKELCKFALSSGDCVFLPDSEGRKVDVIDVPDIEDDKSYVYFEEERRWINNYSPSPGKQNTNVMVEEQSEMLADSYVPVFSKESGFFDTEFYLEMETENGCEIYYTLDGSKPTKESILYTEPILVSDATKQPNKWCVRTDFSVAEYVIPDFLVDKCTIIRAVSVSKDDKYSEEKTATYYVGYEGRYGYEKGYTISIITDPDNLFSDEKGIYVIGAVGKMNEETLDLGYKAITNYNRDGQGWRRPAVVHVFNEKKECVYQQEILLGIHGGYSTLSPQKGFNLIAKEEERIFPGLFSMTQSSLILRPGGVNDTASTKLRDVLNQSLVEERNIVTQAALPCQVFLDGEYWGFYNLRERLDVSMIASKYDVPEENVILLKNGNVLGRSDDDIRYYREMVNYASKNDLAIDRNYRNMEKMMDIQSYIEYCCMEIYCANSDSFMNNYALWRSDTVTDKPYWDGRWRWVVFDTDDSTGMLHDGRTDPQIDSFIEGHWHRDPMDDTLFSSLIKNEEFRIRFAETFYEMCEKEYDIDRVYGFIDELKNNYTEGCVLSHRRYYNSSYSEEEYQEKVSTVSFFYASRSYFIIPYMEEHIVNYSQ